MAERGQQPDRINTFLVGQNRILKRIARGAPLSEVLASLVRLLEAETEGMLGSILLLDEDGLHLCHGAAPSLPETYTSAIDGMSIGPNAGSCGTAAHFKRPVIVTDIHEDPLWKDFRALAVQHGLRACWSLPIQSPAGQVSGTLAMYYRVPREPIPEERRLGESAMHIASIAIQSSRAAEAVRRTEARNQAILRAIPDSMFLLDSDYNYLDCHSRDFCKRVIPSQELIGKNMRDVLPPPLVEKFERSFQRVAESGEPQRVEYDYSVNGQMRYSEARIVPTFDGNFLALVRDITERKNAEQALKESEERFRLVAMATQDGVYDSNLLTRTIWRNESFQVLFSFDKPIENTREWWERRIHPADHDRVMKSIERAFQNHTRVWSCEYAFRRSDGDYATVVDRCYILYDEAGQPVRQIGAINDITERRQAEETLRNREMELRKRNAEIRELAGKLMNAQEEERRRISRELHDDLNQKVAALSIRISKLKNRLGGDVSLRNQVERLQTSSIEIAADIRRLSHELHSAVLEHVGLGAALKAYVAEFNRLEKVKVGLIIPDAVEAIPEDVAVCLYRVAQESLRNIVKHSGVDYAEMKLSVDDQAIHLHVCDSGMGFDPVSARDNGGLGLASMEERVRLVQGSFKILTQPGGGSKLLATIPLRK